MERLVRTSRGWIELDLDWLRPGGFNVTVLVFDEDGWVSAKEAWWKRWTGNEKSLEQFLADTADIPVEEAAQIVEDAVGAWRARGGEAKRESMHAGRSHSRLSFSHSQRSAHSR